jgi:hypothetical protein
MTLAEQLRLDAEEIAGCGSGNEAARLRQAAAEIEHSAATIARMRAAALDRKKTITGLQRQIAVLKNVIAGNRRRGS